MRKMIVAALTGLLMLVGMAGAFAKDAEFDVTTEGIALHEGITFGTNHVIHFDYIDDDGNIHRVRGNDHIGPEGEAFVSWADLGVDGGKVVFVHVTGHGKWEFHKGIPVGPKPEPGHETRDFEEYEEREVLKCPENGVGYGTVTTVKDTIKVTEERTSTHVWDSEGLGWVEVWGEWTETGREVISTETIGEREMTDEEYEACGLPPTGAPLIGAGLAALALLGGGGALALRSRRR